MWNLLIGAGIAAACCISDRSVWKKKWRDLAQGQTPSQAEQLLGAPKNVQVAAVTIWTYGLGGRLIFADGKLAAWSEPKI